VRREDTEFYLSTLLEKSTYGGSVRVQCTCCSPYCAQLPTADDWPLSSSVHRKGRAIDASACSADRTVRGEHVAWGPVGATPLQQQDEHRRPLSRLLFRTPQSLLLILQKEKLIPTPVE
jgi:hypothetical protein